jgi:2-oxoglutarate ferredoxin oxidoreductase subunit delta
LAEIKIDREKCKGCELCVHFCPKGHIKMESGYNRRGYRPACFEIDDKGGNECTGCAICARICPDIAIEVWK